MGPHSGNRFRPAYSGQPKFIFPQNIIELFRARKAPPHVPPPSAKKLRPLDGLASFVDSFESKDSYQKFSEGFLAQPEFETPARARRRRGQERRGRVEDTIRTLKKDFNSKQIRGEATEDAYKTAFVSRLALETTESKLQREFEAYGPVKKVVMPIRESTGLPCGYAFVEFEKDKDMKAAISGADGKKIDGRRIHVDVERGRTVPNWLPNRLNDKKLLDKKVITAVEPKEKESRDRDKESTRDSRGRDSFRDHRDRDGGRDRGDRDRGDRDRGRDRDGGRGPRDRPFGRDGRDYRDREGGRGYRDSGRDVRGGRDHRDRDNFSRKRPRD